MSSCEISSEGGLLESVYFRDEWSSDPEDNGWWMGRAFCRLRYMSRHSCISQAFIREKPRGLGLWMASISLCLLFEMQTLTFAICKSMIRSRDKCALDESLSSTLVPLQVEFSKSSTLASLVIYCGWCVLSCSEWWQGLSASSVPFTNLHTSELYPHNTNPTRIWSWYRFFSTIVKQKKIKRIMGW